MKLLASLPVVAMSLLLTGCAGFTQSVMPSHQVSMNLTTKPQLNIDSAGENSPLYVQFFQLTSAKKFDAATYQQLARNPKAALGKTLVSSSYQVLVANDNGLYKAKVSNHVKYIGIVASYHVLDGKQWRTVIKLQDTWGDENYALMFGKAGVVK